VNRGESTVGDSVEYEEIGDAKSSFSYTQNVVYGISTNKLTPGNSVPEAPLVVESQIPNYEQIEVAEYQTIADVYKVNKCSAYGMMPVERSCDLNTS
jgi:hypothetical protein